MTDVTENRDQAEPVLSAADEQLLRELTERARTGGLKLTGEGGLLGKLTATPATSSARSPDGRASRRTWCTVRLTRAGEDECSSVRCVLVAADRGMPYQAGLDRHDVAG